MELSFLDATQRNSLAKAQSLVLARSAPLHIGSKDADGHFGELSTGKLTWNMSKFALAPHHAPVPSVARGPDWLSMA